MEERSLREERDEGKVLNEKVDRYIHANETDPKEHDARASKVDKEEEMERDKKARILSKAIKEYIISSTSALEGDEDGEPKAEEADETLAKDLVSKVGTTEGVRSRQAAATKAAEEAALLPPRHPRQLDVQGDPNIDVCHRQFQWQFSRFTSLGCH